MHKESDLQWKMHQWCSRTSVTLNRTCFAQSSMVIMEAGTHSLLQDLTDRCSEFLAKNLPALLLKNELCFKDPATALTQTYLEVDKIWIEEATKDEDNKMEDGEMG